MCDLLQSQIGHNPSFAWRSIWNALEVVRQGSRWRVGNRISINIWEDRSTPSTYKVISPQVDIGDTPQVSSLIDPNTRSWRVERLTQYFLPMDVATIQSIPLGRIATEDKRVWIGNYYGIFTVKSAYHIALNLKALNGQEESSVGDPYRNLWKHIWRLKLPSKIRIFAWRACKKGLPTMEILKGRGLDVDPQCQRCNRGPYGIENI
ncbi:putative ribonuclease H protein At1g65750 isoform X2 [Fagus crenata]